MHLYSTISPEIPVQDPKGQVTQSGSRHRCPQCSKHTYLPHHVDETPSWIGRSCHQDVRSMHPQAAILWQTVYRNMPTQWPVQMI